MRISLTIHRDGNVHGIPPGRRPQCVKSLAKCCARPLIQPVWRGGSPHVHTARYESSISAALAHCSKKPAPEQARKGARPQQRVLAVVGGFWYNRPLTRESLQGRAQTPCADTA